MQAPPAVAPIAAAAALVSFALGLNLSRRANDVPPFILARGNRRDTLLLMSYWLNLFTGRTWQEFQAAGAKVSGFREHNWKRAEQIKLGDIFLCYMVGVKRWVGLLEITSARFRADSTIFGEEVFP